MVIQDEAFLGTEKKYLIEIQSTGFDMDRDDFSIVLRRGANKVEIPKSKLIVEPYTIVKDGQEVTKNNYYLVFDTRSLGPGAASITVTAHVPDTDFDDSIRDEVDKFDFLRIKSV
jgi:hypothetical protein